ncbi:MAG: carbohydrate binding domain-containing protein [Armatimonadetes bacterium]|nr:carbohydrate binding domain-containing protein [Armatimonadota bacterium]
MCASLAAADQGARANLLPNPGFEDGLSGWHQRGPAEFAADTEVKFSGRASARITVPEGTKPWYQALYFELAGISEGEQYHAEARVRTRGTTRASAYMALEFLDAASQRVSIYHSEISEGTGRDRWDLLWVDAMVPDTAKVLRLLLVLNENATAWFDDVRLERVDRPAPPSRDLTATLRPEAVISRGWLGFGAQGDLFLWTQKISPKGLLTTTGRSCDSGF